MAEHPSSPAHDPDDLEWPALADQPAATAQAAPVKPHPTVSEATLEERLKRQGLDPFDLPD